MKSRIRRQHGDRRRKQASYETQNTKKGQRRTHPDDLPESVKRVLEVMHPALYGKEHLH